MKHFIKLVYLFLFLHSLPAAAQLSIQGTVYDVTRITPVESVVVRTNTGTETKTDTLGRYSILAGVNDSLFFFYNNKATLRYAVKELASILHFDIALHITVPSKYKAMKEVTIISKSYQQDSVENREKYAKTFGYEKPGISSSIINGGVGLDLDEFINIFRFRRNKYQKKFRARLLQQEQDKYIDYRFNKKTVKNLTRLEGAQLDSFMVIFRPTYEFTRVMTLYDFYAYIKMSGEQYKQGIRENIFFRRQDFLYGEEK